MFLHFLKLLRFNNIAFIALFQIIIRYCIILPILDIHHIEPTLTNVQFVILILATILVAAGGNVINDYFDINTDKINRPEEVVVDKHLDRRTAILIHVILTLIGVFIGLYYAFLFHNENYALTFIGVPIILWFYSTTFKKQMLVGNLIVAMLTALTALLVVSFEFAALSLVNDHEITESTACKQAWFVTSTFAFFAFITNLSREIVKDLEDIEGDTAIGCKTLPIEMGTKYSKIIIILLQLFMITILWLGLIAIDKHINCLRIAIPPATLISLSTLWSIVLLTKAQTNRQYHRVSTVCKLTMLIGTLSIVYLYIIR